MLLSVVIFAVSCNSAKSDTTTQKDTVDTTTTQETKVTDDTSSTTEEVTEKSTTEEATENPTEKNTTEEVTESTTSEDNTEKVTNYQSMFNSCSGLTTLTMGNKFLISSSANTKTMASGLAVVSGAATITCMKATQTAIKASTDFPTVPTFTWVLLDGGGSYEAGGEGYPWG